MLGGTFSDTTNFDPLITNLITEEVYLASEGVYPVDRWYPVAMASINRFLDVNGQFRQRLVLVPGQFRASGAITTTPTIGTQRLYTQLQLEVYTAPLTETDFIAPSIWQAGIDLTDDAMKFQVRVDDDSGEVTRVVVLYRYDGDNNWIKLELPYDAQAGWATTSIKRQPGLVHFFAQAVDPAGNVAMAMDHGNPFRQDIR
jgi:hypothetical protein